MRFLSLSLSLLTGLFFFSPLELLKSFSHWTNNSRSVSPHIPAFLVYLYSLCSCFTVPLLCLLSCIAWWWKLFRYLPFCGERGRLSFSLQNHSPSSHLSQVSTDICCSCMELHGYWFHPAELLPFKGGWPSRFVDVSVEACVHPGLRICIIDSFGPSQPLLANILFFNFLAYLHSLLVLVFVSS